MKKCNYKERDLLAYCYGELNPKKIKELQEHLLVCESCFSKVRGFEKTLNLIKGQKLKKIPEGLLNDYTRQVYEKLNKKPKTVLLNFLRGKSLELLAGFRSIFPSKLTPVFITACAAVFIFVLLGQGKMRTVNLINQEIALFEQVGEDIEEVFPENNGERIYRVIEEIDALIFAQAEEDIEAEDIFYDLELLQELGEEVNDSIVDDFESFDELEIEII